MPEWTAGYRLTEVADLVQGVTLPLRLLYPSRAPEQLLRYGPYELSAAADAPVADVDGVPSGARRRWPLVVVSHGGRSTALTMRGMICALARAGFIVAAPDHMGDCRDDSSHTGKDTNLENRPRHIRLVLDAALADPVVGTHVDPHDITMIGHSMGGYTALAIAGGRPGAGAHETADGRPRLVSVVHDTRVRRLVLMAPGCGWYGYAGALRDVRLPMLVLVAGRDEYPNHAHAEYIARDCDPSLIERHDIPDAGHHGFQSPFPPRLCRPDIPASQDPPGFDRAAFQPELYDMILAWLAAIRSLRLDGCPRRP